MTKIMAILNLTPDSFFEASRYNMSVLDSEAHIVDIGAYSTRPGHSPVSPEEEWSRLEPVLQFIKRKYPDREISIDTFRSEIVRKAHDVIGDFIVNDVYTGDGDPGMLDTVNSLGLKYVATHHKGPADTESVIGFFEKFKKKAEGIDWILDPGFGFDKTVEECWRLLGDIHRLKHFGREILVGVSRKRMTGGSDELTQKAHLLALNEGADILRVHEVDKAFKTLEAFYSSIT